MNLVIKKVDATNLQQAIDLQKTLFPHDNGANDLRRAVNQELDDWRNIWEYYIGYIDETPVGITGIYDYKEYPSDAWLGWFGVLSKYRRKGIGQQLFNTIKQKAKELGYDNFRLYTNNYDNADAINLYTKQNMTQEKYDNPDDKNFLDAGRTFVFSISLDGTDVQKWNNKKLYLSEHAKNN